MEDAAFGVLETPRLVLRRFAAADAPALAAYRSDPEVARYQDGATPYAEAEALRFIASLDGLPPGRPGTWLQLALVLAGDGTLVGDVGLHTEPGDGRRGELGFTLARAQQGRGLASEALPVLVAYAFDRLQMQQLRARTDARNRPAQRLLARLGFRRQGDERVRFKGEWATDLLYAKLAGG